MDDYGYSRRGGGRRGRRNRDEEDEYDDNEGSGHRSGLDRIDSIQDPGKRYLLRDCIGSGVCGDVYEALDQQVEGKKVAVKVQKLTPESQALIAEEYKVLRDLSSHPNLPDFYGIYRRRSGKKTEYDQIWFVMELCEGGTVMDLVKGLIASDKKMREGHIAFILREVIKALMHLHENNVIHRDIRGSNILLTKEGEVKLVDFGLCKPIQGEMGKRYTCTGSPSWMAPEIVTSKGTGSDGYGSRADVWAIGITAIELADGKPPYQDMHPTRALFQILRNPPPTLYRQSNWSQDFNDFIAECLEKNPDNRPFMAEIMEHPFLEVPENKSEYLFSQELKSMMIDACAKGKLDRKPEVLVRKGFLKIHQTDPLEPMFTEDLAALEVLTEDTILDELHERLRQGYYHSFIGDILLILNPNEKQDVYGLDYHTKYQFKSRSDNAPHIYSVADSAYQDVLHNEEPQYILLAGESNSGKTTNMLHLVQHLMYLGKSLNDIGGRLMRAIQIIHAFTNAATPLNPNSTRCVLKTQTTFGSSGKGSGAIFWLYQLEKWRVSTRDRNQSNFHVFYYFYDGLDATSKLRHYNLPTGRRMRYLRISDKGTERKRSFKVRNDPRGNVTKFEELKENLKLMEMDEHYDHIWRILAAILTLGEIRFVEGVNGDADMDNSDAANRVAELLDLDHKKFSWALVNYCIIQKGQAVRKRHTCDEAKEARDALANTIYQRLVDWVINTINVKLTLTRTLFGDKYSISIMDLFGFECFAVNRLEQLIVNTMNEQMQCYYNQKVFAWEMQEQQEEGIPMQQLHFYDNKQAIDQLMNKDGGLFSIIDDAARNMRDFQYVIEKMRTRARGVYIRPVNSCEFTVAHYTGKLVYDASEIAEKNRDYVPPEIIETMRLSKYNLLKELFTNKLSKSGNLTVVLEDPKKSGAKGKWGAAVQESTRLRKFNTGSRGQFSQTKKVRTGGAVFRATSLEILKNLAVGSGATHFVRCVRSDLEGAPRGFYRDVVRQQIRALAILDTAKARQRGYPYRIPFQEFLRRYKFLAFDFDENVEMTVDNCRLLLIRLKMEGWVIGKSKVFLKYYNEEYLSRLYETQVKKIVKVQCMMRAFLARKNMISKVKSTMKKEPVKQASVTKTDEPLRYTDDEAALVLQKGRLRDRGIIGREYHCLITHKPEDLIFDEPKGHVVRKEVAPRLKADMDQETMDLMKFYSSKWRSKSMFQVLLRYRAARYQDLVQFSQQVHLFNQSIAASLDSTNDRIPLEKIDAGVKSSTYLGQFKPPQVHKLPFDMHQELLYFDTTYMNDLARKKKRGAGSASSSGSDEDHEPWDAPLQRKTWTSRNTRTRDVEVQTTNSPHRLVSGAGGQSLIDTPFSRDPNVPVRCPPAETSRGKVGNAPFQESSTNPVRSANAHNPRSNYDSTGSTRSRKQAPAPPIPYNQPPPTRSFNTYDSDNRSKINIESSATEHDHEDRTNKNSAPSNRINPIQELQMKGRRYNNNEDNEDEPPFNFQAMLRKTGHQRASMKRTPVYDSYGASLQPGVDHYRPSSREDLNVVYRSSGSRVESPEWSPNEMVRMSEKYGKEGAWGGGERSGPSESITTEIAPGIVVEGYVAEL